MKNAVIFIRRWGEMVKFSHSVFALPFALMATFLASRSAYLAGDHETICPNIIQLTLIVACMVTARSVAMTFNRIVDANLDARNPRTADRAIPAGKITNSQALRLLLAGTVLFMIFCAGFWWYEGNIWPIVLSLPVLGYLCIYSYTKLFTRYSHFLLGTSIAISPIAAWIAISPETFGWSAVVLMAAVTLWIAGFDIIYACQDVQFDCAYGLHSLPATCGIGQALWIARLAHLNTVILLIILAYIAGLGWIYQMGVVIVALLLLIENFLVRSDNLSRINLAFFTVNGIISVLLSVLTIADILLLTRIPE